MFQRVGRIEATKALAQFSDNIRGIEGCKGIVLIAQDIEDLQLFARFWILPVLA